ncbi:MAG: TonB-dependent receptor [Saprospiraceae bacterium]|nr:TonB-dependent receptor [Saprospiraceae bacterium]
MQKRNYLITCAIPLLVFLFSVQAFTQKAIISGKAIDKETGESLIGVSVTASTADGNAGGAITDFDGNFNFEVDPKIYTITLKYTGYNNFIVEGLDAKPGSNVVDAPMVVSGFMIVETVITARQIKNTDASLIALQKKSFAIQDGISSQQISRTGASDAAEAMRQVPGAVVEGGKFIVMRGLGDRYSITQLNGITMPSTDPYRNSSSLDLIPSQMIDNIVTLKTFTPDMPGNFTGGLANITTKAIPDKFNLFVGGGISFNTQASLIDDFLGHGRDAGNRDWLGYDDGGRTLPDYLKTNDAQLQLSQSAYIQARQPGEANDPIRRLINQSTRDLSNTFTPTPKNTPVNHNFNFSVGNRYKLFGNDLGISLGGNFSRNFEHYQNGVLNTYTASPASVLVPYQAFPGEKNLAGDSKSTETPHIGGLFSLTYKLGLNNSIGINTIYNHDTEIVGRQQEGKFPGQLSEPRANFNTNSLEFVQREYTSYQFNGRHVLPKWNDIEITWAGSLNKSSQKEPDSRYFAYTFFQDSTQVEDPNTGELIDTLIKRYDILDAEFRPPFHFWRDLTDESQEFKVDISIPFLRRGREGSSNQIKIGGLYSNLDRSFEEYQYLHNRTPGIPSNLVINSYQGDFDGFFNYNNFGVIDTTYAANGDILRYPIGYYYINQVNAKNFYTGSQEVAAGYLMGVYNVLPKLKVIAGARVEATKQFVVSRDTTQAPSKLNLTDVLPSLNLIYALSERTNLRAGYSRTLARPNLRELAPFAQFDPKNGFFTVGKPTLKRTLVDNLDLRYEFYPDLGELLAISVFYKNFYDPILRAFDPKATIPELTWINVDEATVFGAELEFRKKLSFLGGSFARNLFLSTNLAIINSKYNIPEQEILQSKNVDPEYSATSRPFQGQAPYIANVILSYVNPDNGWESSLSFNVSGRRLFNIGLFAAPDVFEEAVPTMNFNLTKRFLNHFQVSFSAENLLNPNIRKTQKYKGVTYDTEKFKMGSTFGMSFGYYIR